MKTLKTCALLTLLFMTPTAALADGGKCRDGEHWNRRTDFRWEPRRGHYSNWYHRDNWNLRGPYRGGYSSGFDAVLHRGIRTGQLSPRAFPF